MFKKKSESKKEESSSKKKKTPLLKIKLAPKKKKDSDDEDADGEEEENEDAGGGDEDEDEDTQFDDDEDEEDDDDDNDDENDDDYDDDSSTKKRKSSRRSATASGKKGKKTTVVDSDTEKPKGTGTCKTIVTSYKKDSSQRESMKHTPQRLREFFVKYEGMSYWHCEWISEASLEVFHKILHRYYTTRNDMQNPPSAESLKETAAGEAGETGEAGVADDEEYNQKYYDPALEKTYYRNGVRPQYLQIHRILNYKKTNRGDEW